jgi:GMP synthase-like glutamine amidotransferase
VLRWPTCTEGWPIAGVGIDTHRISVARLAFRRVNRYQKNRLDDQVRLASEGRREAAMRKAGILVFQHMDAGHPGIFRDLLRQDGVAWRAVRLDRGEPIPDLAAFDALWVMGGPQDVWEEAEHPWLADEKAAICEAVLGRAMPFLGICLGHQLLADALGGEVGPAAAPEIGVFEVALNDGAGDHPLFAGLPARSRFLQWHRAEVRRPPKGATVLASSPRCGVQALAVGARAFGLQCHAEVDAATLDEWLGIPAAVADLARALGRDGPARFAAEARAHMAACNRAARQLYANFMTLLPATRRARA